MNMTPCKPSSLFRGPIHGRRVLCGLALAMAGGVPLVAGSGCASEQKLATTVEQPSDGEALSPAPSTPAAPPPPADPAPPSASPAAVAPASPAAETPAIETLTEAQMAKVSEVVNSAELEQAKLAQSRAKSPEVKRFAEKMIKHHGEAQRAQARLVKSLQLAPVDSATAAALKADGEALLGRLKSSDPSRFDAAYVEGQIEAHAKVLDLLDTQLIPAAKTPSVLSALRTARVVVEQHLNEARALR